MNRGTDCSQGAKSKEATQDRARLDPFRCNLLFDKNAPLILLRLVPKKAFRNNRRRLGGMIEQKHAVGLADLMNNVPGNL